MSAGIQVPGLGPRTMLVAALGVAAIAGFAFGSWLGGLSVATATQPTSSRPIASPTPQPTATPSASVAATVEPSLSTEPQGPQEVILSINGTDHDVSRSFEVTPGWQIVWETEGSSIAIAVSGSQSLGIVVNEAGPNKGTASIADGGTFRLEIAASGPWSIRVLQGEG